MSFPIIFLLLFTFIGLADKLANNRLGLAEELDKGLSTMGSLALSMGGIYCFSVMLGQWLALALAQNSISLPFDISILTSSLLATDMGAYSISSQISPDHSMVLLSGILLSSMLGSTISFALPIALSSVEKKNVETLMHGIVYGILTIPFALLLGGLLVRVPLGLLARNLLPIIAICALLCLCIFKAKAATTAFFTGLGQCIRWLSCILFGAVILQAYWGDLQWIELSLIHEILLTVFKICIIVCGSFVLSKLVLRYFMHPIIWCAKLLKINEFSIIGLLLSLVTSISMFAVFDKMDRRGQMMNAACSVTSAFVLGGQMAFVSAMEPGFLVGYIVVKLFAGVLSVAIVSFVCKPDDVVSSLF